MDERSRSKVLSLANFDANGSNATTSLQLGLYASDFVYKRPKSDKCSYVERGILLPLGMIQNLLVGALFAGALGYLIRLVLRSFGRRKAMEPGCAKCQTPNTSTHR